LAFITLVAPLVTDVAQYGGDPTGATASDSAFTSALAAIPTSTGGVLYIPPGSTYLLQNGIDVSAYNGNLWIVGGGESSVLKLANGANTYLIKNISGFQQDMAIASLKLDCNSANQTAASGGIYGYKYRRCVIEKVWIHNPWQAGIYLIGDSGGDFGYQNRINKCWIEGGSNVSSGTGAYGNGLRLENTDENVVSENHFEANGNFSDSTYGFHIYDKNGLTDYTDNSFVNGYGVMKFDGLQNTVKGNRFDGNGAACVQCNSSASDTIIIGNQMFNIGYRASGGSANATNGIYLNAPRCIVRNNNMWTSAGSYPYTNSFVNVDTSATYGNVEENEFNIQTGSGTLGGAVTFVSGIPTGFRHRNNNGYDFVNSRPSWLTENHGNANITTGNTTVVVTHGLAMTPTLEQIMVTPQTSLGAAAFYWVSNATSTQFTINLNANPTQTVTFGWRCDVGW
jgi:hypothetical protein